MPTVYKLLLSLLLLLCLSPARSGAQTLYEPFEIRMIDTTTGSKDVLFNRLKTWMNGIYHTHRDVIEQEDKQKGMILGKGTMVYPVRSLVGLPVCDATIYYNIKIEVKEGRYRCTMSDFVHAGCYTGKENTPNGGPLANEKPNGKLSKKQWSAIKSAAADEGMDIMRSLKRYMENEASKTDEW